MILDFYNSIFPPLGYRALAVFKYGLKNAPIHSYYKTNEDLLATAGAADSKGQNVYHGCAVYKEPTNRTQDNALAAKTLWADFDVGPNKPHATQRDAVAAYEAFRKAVDLPAVWYISSGGGIHAYQPFTKPVSAANWNRIAAAYAACMDHFGVKHDSSRTTDSASILRVPGTSNYKTSPAKAVRILKAGAEDTAQAIYKKLKDYAEANGVLIGEKPKGKIAETNDLIGNKDYPPSEGAIVAQHCPVLYEVDDSGGDIGYEVWWRAMGVAKHTTDSTTIAAHWTRNRSATGHDKSDWQGAVDAWNAGPTTCTEFAKHCTHCANCPQNGKITSPIQLGVPAVPVTINQQQIQQLQQAPAVKHSRPPWEFMAPWIVTQLQTEIHIGVSTDGKLTRSMQQEDGTYKQTPFCDRYWQVLRRIRGDDNIWKLEIGYLEYRGRPHQTFTIDSATVASAELLKKEFAARELHIYGGKGCMEKAQEKIRWDQAIIYSMESEVKTYPTLGWETVVNGQRDDTTGDFVMGDEVYSRKLLPTKAKLGASVEDTIRRSFRTKGTTERWVDIVDEIYNRPGAEAYQFLIASSFASPLVSLVPSGGEWHGIPIVVTGDSGAAKTTSCLVAMSVWGYAQNLKFNASASQGDTLNATTIKLGTLRNLPCILDEMSGLEPDALHGVLSTISNGKGKDRMGKDGKMMPNPYFWDTLPLINTNDKIHEVLEGLRSQFSTQAMQLRAFEVNLYASDLRTVFRGVNKTLIEDELLDGNYGCVGREWIQFVVNNRELISKTLGEERSKYMVDPLDTSAIRFFKDLMITIKVASALAKRQGFIKWNVSNMMVWAETELKRITRGISVTNWPAQISDFIASFHGKTIVTNHMKLGPGRRSANVEMPQDALTPNHVPVARKAVKDKRFVFVASYVKEWCGPRRILPSTLIAEMLSRGYLKPTGGDVLKPLMINIGSATTVSRPQAPCYELDYDKVGFEDSDETVNLSNVVPLQSVTALVTEEEPAAAVTAASP